jgi:hypothetical protein
MAQRKLWRLSHGGVFKDESITQRLHRSNFDEDYSVKIHRLKTKNISYESVPVPELPQVEESTAIST